MGGQQRLLTSCRTFPTREGGAASTNNKARSVELERALSVLSLTRPSGHHPLFLCVEVLPCDTPLSLLAFRARLRLLPASSLHCGLPLATGPVRLRPPQLRLQRNSTETEGTLETAVVQAAPRTEGGALAKGSAQGAAPPPAAAEAPPKPKHSAETEATLETAVV